MHTLAILISTPALEDTTPLSTPKPSNPDQEPFPTKKTQLLNEKELLFWWKVIGWVRKGQGTFSLGEGDMRQLLLWAIHAPRVGMGEAWGRGRADPSLPALWGGLRRPAISTRVGRFADLPPRTDSGHPPPSLRAPPFATPAPAPTHDRPGPPRPHLSERNLLLLCVMGG